MGQQLERNEIMQDEIWLQPWIWLDYKLAVLFTVIVPLVLFIWSLFKRQAALTRLLVIYWRVASLLMITVYLLIPGWPVGYLTGFLARLLIPTALWFWADLNEDIADQPPNPFKLALTGWRWAVSVYCAIATFASIPFLSCAFSRAALNTPFCQVWREPPVLYRAWFHANSQPGFLGFLGAVGLTIYALYFGSFMITRLGKRGRSAMEQ
ncbi:DUF3177 family protein [Spirulina major CS-329]|nr:DUF3177 family protein [Spirulina subsalsa CS-330]MDB9502253.1 DUF3177 family protein [Spirulina major CS-329]